MATKYKQFRDRPIRQKLFVIVSSAVLTAIFVVGVSTFFYDRYYDKQVFIGELDILAQLTAQRSSAALLFNDRRTLDANLKSLFIQQSMELACFYSTDGRPLSAQDKLSKNVCPELGDPQQKLRESSGFVALLQPVNAKSRVVGYLLIQVSTEHLKRRQLLSLLVTFGVGLVALVAAWLLTFRLQRSLITPITQLSQVAEQVREHSNYSLRVDHYGNDEIGSLIQSFNRLLGTTQENQLQMHELVLELKEKSYLLESRAGSVEERNKSIRDMFAGASHDLRQPLQAMTIFVGALMEVSDEAQRPLISKLDFAIDNLNHLFTDLLDVSKLESRFEKVSFSSVSLRPLLERVFHEFDALAGDRNLSLRFHMREYVVESNATMLERIIRNLLSNAIRYTRRGGVLLACRKRSDSVWIEIWDTGTGIPEDKLQSVFKQFVQLDKGSDEGKQGFGLGLSIVKRLNDLLGHQITVDSREGRGTVFRIELPVYRRGQMEPAAESVIPAAQLLEQDSAPSIILIDDDDTIRDSLQLLLQSWGMQVQAFASVAEIWDSVSANQLQWADLILSDFELSDTETAFDAIATVRAGLRPQLPALIISGTSDEAKIKQIKDSDYSFLKKPVKPAKLRALIQYTLNQQ